MSSVPPSQEQLSLRLSEVLSDIGVNHEMIMKRRESTLFRECASNIDGINGINYYLFGSQSEGSTTKGLCSDDDVLVRLNKYHVVHDLKDVLPGVPNFLMIQDETTSHGYCTLQILKDGVPVTGNCDLPHTSMDIKGRRLLNNTLFHIFCQRIGYIQHGPAAMSSKRTGVREQDLVLALFCPLWSNKSKRCVNKRSQSEWPTAELKYKFETFGCFLVSVSSKTDNGFDQLEWRISTSLHERSLMFSLNTTHMSCYVLMKMFLKSYREFNDLISSYMCKTVLFHCIENTNSDFWQDTNLIVCLKQILWVLYIFVYYNNCPHFIIPENNLMAGRISTEQKYKMLKVIQYIFSNTMEALFEIQIDDVGERLQMRTDIIREYSHHVRSPVELHRFISAVMCINSARNIKQTYFTIINRYSQCKSNVQDNIHIFLSYMHHYVRYNQRYPHASDFEQKAYSYLLPMLCSTIGSLLASYYIALNKPILNIAWEFLKLGYNSDVSSGLLKLATVCYSVGDYDVTESILRYVEQKYDIRTTMPVCEYDGNVEYKELRGFGVKADQTHHNEFRHIVSYCVSFLPFEDHVVPAELRQEYSRSTAADIESRGRSDGWMDHAVVDSLPYLYFLQYKTYGRLGDVAGQMRALYTLVPVTRNAPTLAHRETALNLLGQCMEQENQPIEAIRCYERSLHVRSRNNAANFHIPRLLARLYVRIPL